MIVFGEVIARPQWLTRMFMLLVLATANAAAQNDTAQKAAPAPSPSKQELLYRAQYWERQGRSDLAEKLRIQAEAESVPATTGSVATKSAEARSLPTGSSVAEKERDAAEPTLQELEARANYWEARGRSDLAEKIRQKWQPTEAQDPVRPARNKSEIRQETPPSAKAQIRPDSPEALYASAQQYAGQHLWKDALQVLEQIPPAARNREMASLQKTAWTHAQIERADELVRQGRNAEAEVLLRQIAQELSSDTSQLPPLWKPAANGKKDGNNKSGK